MNNYYFKKVEPVLVLALILFSFFQIQAQNYDDVAVIVNDNSTASIEIATYFKNARNIPEENIIHINCTTENTISPQEYEEIANLIISEITNSEILPNINYLVTTKGIPVAIDKNLDPTDICNGLCTESLDAKLTLLFSSLSGPSNPQLLNPFFESTSNFSRSAFDCFLVTRLDAYNKEEVFNYIDQTQPNLVVSDIGNKTILLDVVYEEEEGIIAPYMVEPFFDAQTILVPQGWNVIVDTFPGNYSASIDHVMAYFTLGLFHDEIDLNLTWESNAFNGLHFGGATSHFDNTLEMPTYMLADLIQDSGAAGFAPIGDYFVSDFKPAPMLTAYFDTQNNFNLAESYYKGIRRLGAYMVVMGDPKVSINPDLTSNTAEDLEEKIQFNVYPNPTNEILFVTSNVDHEKNIKLSLLGNNGQLIFERDIETNNGFKEQVDVNNISAGIYFIKIETGNETIIEQFMKN